MKYSQPFLGKIVEVKVDRQLGTKHPKNDMIYPINYGFIPGTLAHDGAELVAYILGIDEPVQEFKGRCIALIHRTDDDDDKLIVCEEGKSYTDEEIRELTLFQEQWFESETIRP
ncbi:MAG: inorganic diphosphatase [bacterium]